MTGPSSSNPHIIGLTGSFGSGCTYVAEKILAGMDYEILSLSDTLRDEYSASGRGDARTAPRRELQSFGDEWRQKHGAAHFAALAYRKIEAHLHDGTRGKWVVDSIRNPAEVHFFKATIVQFFLVRGLCHEGAALAARSRHVQSKPQGL